MNQKGESMQNPIKQNQFPQMLVQVLAIGILVTMIFQNCSRPLTVSGGSKKGSSVLLNTIQISSMTGLNGALTFTKS
jgi:hypothetical protein